MYKEINLRRTSKGEHSTIGMMTIGAGASEYVECFSCEDENRIVKKSGETRIGQGRYKIELRQEGGLNKKYSKKYDFHRGMLWLRDVPDFKYIYIHTGNDHNDTEGCILVGLSVEINQKMGGGCVSQSVAAYENLYKKIIDWMTQGYDIYINVYDEVFL
tara:strand:+ start:1941 stop:2417 length:477 start_codon:yes stop_codon:yes gene_type:complete